MIQKSWMIVFIIVFAVSMPVLGKTQQAVRNIRTRFMAPYDLLNINYLGMNYLESTYDERMKLVAFAQDAPTLHYVVDNCRVVSALVEEAEHTPIVRLELIKELTEGILSAEVPGMPGKYFYKHCSTKTNLFTESVTNGWITQKYAGDRLFPVAELGFRVGNREATSMEFTELDSNYGSRDSTDSPVRIHRIYDEGIEFIAEYRNGNDDRMPFLSVTSPNEKDNVTVYIGDGWKELDWFDRPGDYFLETAEEKVKLSRGRTFNNPKFNYVIFYKHTDFLGDYGKAMLVVWEGRPSRVQIFTAGPQVVTQIAITGKGKQMVYVLPFALVNPLHTEYIKQIAENTLDNGKMGMGRFNPQKSADYFAPLGLAAAGYILQKYDDPWASHVLSKAKESLDLIIDSEKQGVKAGWLFHIVHGASYMVRAGYDEYIPWIDKWIDRMFSTDLLYERLSHTWPWLDYQIKNMYATYDAYEVLKNEKYLKLYSEARNSIKIQSDGIHWKGSVISYGVDDVTALLVGLFGHTEPDEVQIVLDNTGIYVNDYGMGPWGCSDINPKYTGYSTSSLGLQGLPKVITKIGEFPIIVDNQVVLTHMPTVYFIGFPNIEGIKSPVFDLVCKTGITPGTSDELDFADSQKNSQVGPNVRCIQAGGYVIYKCELEGVESRRLDLEVGGDYIVEISKDKNEWKLIDRMDEELVEYFRKKKLGVDIDTYFPDVSEVFVRISDVNSQNERPAGIWWFELY